MEVQQLAFFSCNQGNETAVGGRIESAETAEHVRAFILDFRIGQLQLFARFLHLFIAAIFQVVLESSQRLVLGNAIGKAHDVDGEPVLTIAAGQRNCPVDRIAVILPVIRNRYIECHMVIGLHILSFIEFSGACALGIGQQRLEGMKHPAHCTSDAGGCVKGGVHPAAP